MSIYNIPDSMPINAYLDDEGKVIIGKDVMLNEDDSIYVKKGSKLTILPNVKLDIKELINHGYVENAGDILIEVFENHGEVNNVDLLIIKNRLYNNGLIENYNYLYLLKAREINNKDTINNYLYIGAFVFYDVSLLKGNKIKNFS